jgi:hypothetical protein
MTNDQLDVKNKKVEKTLSEQRVKNSISRIAKSLNLLEAVKQELKWACEASDWNDEVVYQISEAAELLGYSLATLINWDNDADQ